MKNNIYGSAPIFMVTDVKKSADYYCHVLGFEQPNFWGDPIFFAMPRRENFIIMLHARGEMEVRHNKGFWDAYFWVKAIDPLFESFKRNGAIITYEPEIRAAYGNYEFAVKDPDGYTIAFAQEINEDATFEYNPING